LVTVNNANKIFKKVNATKTQLTVTDTIFFLAHVLNTRYCNSVRLSVTLVIHA